MLAVLAGGVLRLVIAPYAAWRVALLLDPSAHLVGPYLLVSPIIAMTIGSFVFTRLIKWNPLKEGESIRSEEIEARVKPFADRLRVKKYEVRLFLQAPEYGQAAVGYRNGSLRIYPDNWETLSWAERDFLMVQSMWLMKNGRSPFQSAIQTFAGLFFLILSALNLWAIIAFQVATSLYFAMLFWVGDRLQARADIEALRLTGDLEAAVNAIRSTASPTDDRIASRVEALRLAGLDLAAD